MNATIGPLSLPGGGHVTYHLSDTGDTAVETHDGHDDPPRPLTEVEADRAAAHRANQAAVAAQARTEATTRDLHDKAANALTGNKTYLAVTTPTTAQMRAQLAAVTRQNNALIRLLVGLLDDTSDT